MNKNTIVTEWSDKPMRTSPVRKVTRTEIVPGTYGRVRIDQVDPGAVSLKLTDRSGNIQSGAWFISLNASEIRSAASVFTELADALDAMAKEGVK